MITFKAETNWEKGKAAMQGSIGTHTLIMDEPATAPGADPGPGPIHFLLTGLGGCFMTLGRIVADEMGLNIEHMRCNLEGDLNTDGMMAKDPAVRAGLQEIRLTIEAKTAEPADKLDAWLKQVEARCPIRDSLSRPVPIKVIRK